MLKAFHDRLRDRLRDLCADDGEGSGRSRAQHIENEAQQVRALADKFGFLKRARLTWDELRVFPGCFRSVAKDARARIVISGRIPKAVAY
jgi:hypothetical protein